MPIMTAAHRAGRDRLVWRLAVPLAGALAGLLAVTSMINAKGTDLRGGRNISLIDVVEDQRDRVAELRRQAASMQAEVDRLTEQVNDIRVDRVQAQVDKLAGPTGLTAVHGPGLVVELDDAPLEGRPEDVDPNVLIVHQQDLQAVVNALWAGGADAMSLQGQRIISTTGIKCVGNTVKLQGVPYAPPYRIVAIGDPQRLDDALDASPQVQSYLSFVPPPYNLGWSVRSADDVTVPAYDGSVQLQYARRAS